jgi:Flp pilus assembly protein TadD
MNSFRKYPKPRRIGWAAAVMLAAAATEDAAAAAAAPTPSPHEDCYQAARAGSTAPYACDLAVEAARDAQMPTLLAAALANRALIFTRDGRFDAALEDLDAALNLAPADPALHGNLGNLLLRLSRPSDAVAAHEAAVRLRPDDPLHRYNQAFSYRALGDPARAARTVAELADGALPLTRADRSAAGADRYR